MVMLIGTSRSSLRVAERGGNPGNEVDLHPGSLIVEGSEIKI